MLKELISSSRYSNNINVGRMQQPEFKERCKIVVDAFSKFCLFFKTPVEPLSQLCDESESDEKSKGEMVTATLGFLRNLQTDTLSGTMEPAFISKKRGMSRNAKLSDVHSDDSIVIKHGLAMLCASLVSSDGILSVPLQLGAKLLLSRAAVICPGMESWNRPLVKDDPEFVDNVCKLSLIHI